MARWFGPGLRSSIATEVEEVVAKPGRTFAKSFYDGQGRDVRLSVPGVRWKDVRERRKAALESFKERCQEAFDKVYQQIVEGRRTSMSHHLLPTMKTPAIPNKVQSRLRGNTTSPHPPASPPHPPASPPSSTTPLSTVFTPRSTARMQTENTSVTTSKPGKGDNFQLPVHTPENKENIPATLPKQRHQHTLPVDVATAKPQPLGKEEKGAGGGTRRVTRASIRGHLVQSPVSLPPPSARTTRSRAARTCTRGGRGANPRPVTTKSREEDKAEHSVCSDPPSRPDMKEYDISSHVVQKRTPEREKEVAEGNSLIPVGHSTPPLGQSVPEAVDIALPGTQEKDTTLKRGASPSSSQAKFRRVKDATGPRQLRVAPDASPPGTATRRQTRSRVKRSALPPPVPSSPLLASSKKRLRTGTSSLAIARSTRGKCKSASTVTQSEESPHGNTAASHSHSKEVKSTVTASREHVEMSSPAHDSVHVHVHGVQTLADMMMDTETGNKGSSSDSEGPTPVGDFSLAAIPVASSGTPELSSVPPHIAGHTETDTTPQDGKSGSESDDQETFHTPMSTLPKTTAPRAVAENYSDSGLSSRRQMEGGEGHGSICGKRLRSVSLEKLPLDEVKPKRISLLVNTPESEVESHGMPLPIMRSSLDTAPSGEEDLASGCSSEENMPSEDSQELHTSPLGEKVAASSCSDGSSPEERATTTSSNEEEGEGEAGGTSDSSPSDNVDRANTEQQAHVPSSLGAGFNSKSPVVNLMKMKPSPWSFLSKKAEGAPPKLVFSNGARPISFLPRSSPRKQEGEGKLTLANGTVLPLSFVARNSPQQKVDTKESRQKMLMEKLLKKKEEEEQRKRELEEKRLQEIEGKKRKNAERAQRAAEKRRQEEEKKKLLRKRAQEMESDELSKKQQILNQQKANERKERTKRHNEHVAAVLARKKVEEEIKSKKLQQIEEDRKMAEELQRQRMEREEEERQQKRLERQRLERERQLQREAEERERQLQREAEEKERQLQREAEEQHKQDVAIEPKGRPRALAEEKKKVFQQLLASACTVNMPSTTSRFIQEWKSKLPNGTIPTTVTKSKPALPIPLPNIDACTDSCHPPPDTSPPTDLNSTFTKETASRDIPQQTPVHTSGGSKLPEVVQSYLMTPAEPILTNYDIQDLSSGDSTDEEERPKKPIPVWALSSHLKPIVLQQEEKVSDRRLDPCDIFPPNELLKDVDLARIFKHKRRRFYHRSSSARWDSPILVKKGRMDDFSA